MCDNDFASPALESVRICEACDRYSLGTARTETLYGRLRIRIVQEKEERKFYRFSDTEC